MGCALVILAGLTGAAAAHKPSDSYLRLGSARPVDGGAIELGLRWDVSLRDLDRAVGLDTNRDGAITWGEVRSGDRAARALLLSHLSARRGDTPCNLRIDDRAPPAIVRHSDGAYTLYELRLRCAGAGEQLELSYSLLFDLDPQHRGLLRAGDQVFVFSRGARTHVVPLPTVERPRSRLLEAIGEGVHHIWTGYDHLLFLLALLLPSVLRREGRTWVPVSALRPAVVDVLKVVTAFTAAHSVTLSLAALGALSLPSRLVESAIAASVVLAALNNLWPVVKADRWLAAFALGLLHGFGFSSTLADLGLDRAALLPTLVGFNLGVELGQAAVVAAFVPLAYLGRRRPAYRWGALQLGSIAIALVATLWLIERAFDVVILSR